MNKEELYNLALSGIHEYNLLNEIFAIRDKRVETEDYTIGVNGFISLDALNQYINKIKENQQLKEENSIIYCQLEEMQMNKTDNTEVNILEMKLQQREIELNDCMIERNKYASISEHLEKELQHKYNNFPKTVKDLSKEQLESLYLDLLHIENEEHNQLQQRDEVIGQIKNILISCMTRYGVHNMNTKDFDELLDILSKGRKSHEN